MRPKFVCPTLQKAKTQASEFGVRRGLLIEKVPTEKMGVLILKSIFGKYKSSGFFYVKRSAKGRARVIAHCTMYIWGQQRLEEDCVSCCESGYKVPTDLW